MLHEPIQVKQSSGIGRNVVDNFETALKRSGKNKGYIVAFSFGKGAYEEAARVKGAVGLAIELLKVADLLEGKADLVTPETGLFGADVPMPEARSPEARSSIEELIASDAGQELHKVAERRGSYDGKPLDGLGHGGTRLDVHPRPLSPIPPILTG